jgi:hypothetical protein
MPDNSLFLIILIIVIAVATFLLLPKQPETYIPGVSFSISQNSIDVKDNQVSTGIVTITVIKNDDKGIPTTFQVKLESSNPNNMYPISVNTNQPLTEYNTKQLIDKGASDSQQFKVLAKLPEGTTSASYKLIATIYYNNTRTPNDQQFLNVNVKQ